MADAYLSLERLDQLLELFPQSNIAVVGDFFLDEYLVLDKSLTEISLETGLPAFQVTSCRKNPGVAGTVTNILRSMEVPVTAIGFCGDDGHGFELRRCLLNQGINLQHFAIFEDRFTPTYTKPMLLENGSETEQSRLDSKNRQPLPLDHENQLIRSLRDVAASLNVVLVIDQARDRNCGVVTDAMRAEIAALAARHPEKIFMADSRDHMSLFRNSIVKFNVNEASKMLEIAHPQPTPEFFTRLSYKLFHYYNKPILLTLGEQGMQVTDQAGSLIIPAIPISGPTDIVGAGDSVMAAAGAALSVGASTLEAAIIGNLTASLIIQQIGTTGLATRQQIRQRFCETRQWLNDSIRVMDNPSLLAEASA
ncbi:MAG: PfkB family carbohydrate kinase [Chloroflexi bacterium]|nr:PfkB family carbohydrate kinase [Chloroflexota bacterium]